APESGAEGSGEYGTARQERDVADGAALARELAVRSFTLLTNHDGALPLTGVRTLALIGEAAANARIMGGGSAQVYPASVVSPLAGLRRRDDVEVRHALGTDPRVRLAPVAAPTRALFLTAGGEVLGEERHDAAETRWISDLPRDVDGSRLAAVELKTTLVPEISGRHVLSIAGTGAFRLVAIREGLPEVLFDETVAPEGNDPAALLTPPERRIEIDLTAGVPVELTLHHPTALINDTAFISFNLGHSAPAADPGTLIAEAVALAEECEAAVVVAGTTLEVESEGFDRRDLRLPGRQDELISRVAAANPRTIVVVNAGSPIEMPWLGEVAAVLVTWFPGQEGGAALADVLYGDAEPGGRLPTTWPLKAEDCPVLDVTPEDGALPYDEGIFIGYRGWERARRRPAFWFGHGLGYTTWSYNEIAVTGTTVTVSVTNTGTRAGREVVQVYLSPVEAPGSEWPGFGRPARWLAGFDVVEAEPGQTVFTTIVLPDRAFQIWTAGGWRTVTGDYSVEAGSGLGDRRVAAITSV
ncbi:glycoside hydrolase family 3 protein, partial [Sinosporangium siamense]